MSVRELQQVIEAQRTSDGAGVVLYRSLGQHQSLRMDPWLMLDEFCSEKPEEYLGGFPDHPHRGFETVTYMLAGHMLHHDHLGNSGDLRAGDVQWMTAGRGIIHSEMPQQLSGRMHGFQLWLNLPAASKMQPPSYRDIPASDIPSVTLTGGVTVKVIAGKLQWGERQWPGPAQAPVTEPIYWDVSLPAGQHFDYPLPTDYRAMVYVYEGALQLGEQQRSLQYRQAGLLTDGDSVHLSAGQQPARCLLIAGKPLGEPIAQWGPFVMNTPAEIEQALDDYRHDRLV